MISVTDLTKTGAARWVIIVAVMTATLMQVLDTTIVNVALPHMQGELDATPDQISWTLTSYLIAAGIFMPLTGYLTDRIGRKKYLLICIAGFTIASALCGAAINLDQIVIFRLIQGVFGAALVPLSQAIITDIYSQAERGKGMAIWGMGVMIGPILGPTLGGYLTDIASWRWTFYINIPFGILALILAWYSVPATETKARSMDWTGLIYISVAIGALQYLLDRGNQQDWLNAADIRIAAILTVLGLISFILHNFWNRQKTVFDLKIFKDRNFTIASLLLAMFGLGMYGTMVIQPLMQENLLNYPVLTTGLVMAPRGLSGMIGMFFIGRISNRVDPRYLIFFGILLSAAGTYIGTYYSQNVDIFWLVWPLILQGFGSSMIFVPLSTVAFTTLSENMRVEAAGLFSLLRTIGSSTGISLAITVFTRHTQMAWNQLGGFINIYNPALHDYLNALQLNINQPLATNILGNELIRQAQMIAFVDTYYFIMMGYLLMLPLVLFIKGNKAKTNSAANIVIE